MVCSETGSGKTAAYVIPVLCELMKSPSRTSVILAPTRELAQQIIEVVKSLTQQHIKVKAALLVGGMDIRRQLTALHKKPQIIVATPGRLTDHLRRKSLNLAQTAILILDEGDRMIDMGFAPQLETILKYLPTQRQTLFFTATLPLKVRKLAEKYLNSPETISVGATSRPVKSIKQSVIQTTSARKDDQLMDELNRRKGSVIIFTRTKDRTDRLTKVLKQYGFAASSIHGGRTQGQRNQALQGFRSGDFRILCATDIAARGIDVPHVEHVINYDLPMMDEDYVHRIGRTGRNGAEGEALSFVLPHDYKNWNALTRKFHLKDLEIDSPYKGSEKSSGGRGPKKKKRYLQVAAPGQRTKLPKPTGLRSIPHARPSSQE